MNTNTKPVELLDVHDFAANAVWEYADDEGLAETDVRPVERLPVENLNGKVVGTRVQLANGARVWASVGNVDVRNPRSTQQFITLSVERDGAWFSLSRYHDFNYAENGPGALARFLDLSVDEVFPISYDISAYSKGDPSVLSGTITKEPRERLSRTEIIALALQ